MTRNTIARILLILYALGCLAVTLAQLLNRAGDMTWTTSGKILAAATFAFGFGAAMASRDPWQNRLVVQILIVFMACTTLAIVYRILTHGEVDPGETTWIVLAAAAAAPVLFAVFYPRPPQE